MIAASFTVGKEIGDYKLVLESPGKEVKYVREIVSKKTGLSHYPWPYNFERGMPWEKITYPGPTGTTGYDMTHATNTLVKQI